MVSMMSKKNKYILIGVVIVLLLGVTRIIQPTTNAELYGGTPSYEDNRVMEFGYGEPVYLNTSCFFFHIIPISIYCSGPVLIEISKWNGSDWEIIVYPPITLCSTFKFYINQKTTYCLNDLLENSTGYREFPIGYYKVSTTIAGNEYIHYFIVTEPILP